MQLEEIGCQVPYTDWAVTDRRECVMGQLCRLDAQYDEGQDIGANAYGLHGGGVSTALGFRGKESFQGDGGVVVDDARMELCQTRRGVMG